MAEQTLKTRIKLKRDTSANWETSDPVLLNGEKIIIDTANGEIREKIGDGVKTYSQLPFTDEGTKGGKVLSSNDYTDNEKTQVAKISILQQNQDVKANNGEVLRINVPNNAFTPIQPYHPATKKYVDDSVAAKVDKEDGKGLSSNDYTDDEKTQVAKISVLQQNQDVKANNGEVLRINVPNNAFTPIQPYHPATKKYVDDSVAAKVDKEDGKGLSSNDYTDNEKTQVAKISVLQQNQDIKANNGEVLRINVPNNAFTPKQPYHPATKKYVDDSVAAKVDKEDGKGLSSNDYTDNEKTQVAKISVLQQNQDIKANNGEVLRINVPNNAFTPKQPYHPATKKYVDDSVAALKTELLALINKS